jgi:nicotinate-nucleotide pyrophosphorylase (carboxylating)
MDRWVTAILGDDGIDGPLMGFGEKKTARIIAKSTGTVAGAAVVDYMMQIWAPGLNATWRAGDGRRVSEGDIILELQGDSESLLRIERSVLNILGQLSGIATESAKWAQIAARQVAATRKTVWGLLDKWAVHLGGGLTHRLNKDDAMMIKENDLASLGSESLHAIVAILTETNLQECGAFLELEVTNEKEAIIAATTWNQRKSEDDAPPLVLMLDNFGPERCKEMVAEMIEMGLRDAVVLEASGNIVFDDLEEWRECGVDVLSTSAVNRGTPPLDISMLIGQN